MLRSITTTWQRSRRALRSAHSRRSTTRLLVTAVEGSRTCFSAFNRPNVQFPGVVMGGAHGHQGVALRSFPMTPAADSAWQCCHGVMGSMGGAHVPAEHHMHARMFKYDTTDGMARHCSGQLKNFMFSLLLAACHGNWGDQIPWCCGNFYWVNVLVDVPVCMCNAYLQQ